MDSSRTLLLALLLVASLAMLVGIGVVSGLDGEFSSTYDGLDSDDSENPGREIEISGGIEITGSSSAINPRITIEPTDATVLDMSSLEVLVSGDEAVEFDTQYRADSIVLTTDEMTPDTRVELRFLAYPIGGTDRSTIESAVITFDYETPGGNDESEVFTVETDVSDSPETKLAELQQSQQIQEGFGWAVLTLAVVGALAVIALVGFVGIRFYKRYVGNGGGKGRRRR